MFRLDDECSADDPKAWQAGTPADWANESLALTIKYVHQLPESREISAAYVQRALPILHKRLEQAGVRLAWLLNEAMKSVQAEYVARGKAKTFDFLKGFLPGVSAESPSYVEGAKTLGISEAAVNTLIHRLRKQYSIALRREVARTVSEPGAIDDEIHLLFEALVAAEGYLAQ